MANCPICGNETTEDDAKHGSSGCPHCDQLPPIVPPVWGDDKKTETDALDIHNHDKAHGLTTQRGKSQGSEAQSSVAMPPPMPESPDNGLWSTLPFSLRVIWNRLQRWRAIYLIDRAMAHDRALLDDRLRDLGRAVWDLSGEQTAFEFVPDEDAEIAVLTNLQRAKERVEAAVVGVNDQADQAEKHFEEAQADCNARIEAAQARIDQLHKQIATQSSERSELLGKVAQLRKQILFLERQRDQHCADAQRIVHENDREQHQQLAAERAIEIGDLHRQKEQALDSVKGLEIPIAKLKEVLRESKGALRSDERNVKLARQELLGTRRTLDADQQRQRNEADRISSEIAIQLIKLGKIAQNNTQIQSTLSAQWDAVKNREQSIDTLLKQRDTFEFEQQNFDHQEYHRGIFLLGGIVALVIIAIFLPLALT